MKNLVKNLTLIATVSALALFLMAGVAGATPPTPAEVVTDGASGVVDSLTDVIVALLPIIVPLLAIVMGWRLARRFIKV
jgi:hypothetical protein